MRKEKGIHLYISIINFNDIILQEESQTGNVIHSLHALDTFFTSIEQYGKKVSPQDFVIEKITGSRLHLYVLGEPDPAFHVVKTISSYAHNLSKYINSDIPKYKSLGDFKIQIGADYGKFYEFEFVSNDKFTELTTIGYVANFAAKIQALSKPSKLSISKNIFDTLSEDEQKKYEKIENKAIEKYGQKYFYSIPLSSVESPLHISDEDLEFAKKYANSDNLSDIEFTKIRKLLNFQNLSKTQCKELYGIPVFADVRGFTTLFKEEDSNLEEMTETTQNILKAMYGVSTENGGIHVQFQGDRELSLYHNIPESNVSGSVHAEKKCFKEAVIASMRMIDAVKPYNVQIGIGEDFGRLFATKIGARGEKDNILLGETIIEADKMEDKYAGADQIAISQKVYSGLEIEAPELAEQFTKKDDYYIIAIGHKQYLRNVSSNQQTYNTSHNSYNGAWGDLQ